MPDDSKPLAEGMEPDETSDADRTATFEGEPDGAPNVGEAAQPDADVLEESERLRLELADLREMYLRKLAEFDNFRKRTEREREEFARTAGEGVVRELVPVLDNFERALQHGADDGSQAFRQGVEMIARQLWDVLQRQGLEVIDPGGQPFEPEFHEAVQRVEGSDHPPGTVVWVAAKGYLFGGRLLRPAMVGVAVEPPRNDPDRTEAGDGDDEP